MNVGGDVPAGYKRTELGVIPKGWVVHPLREICWFQEGPGVRDTQFTASGVKLLNGTNIANGKLNLANTARFISVKEANGPYAHFLADTGDIVLASSGISIDRLAEKVAYVGECDRPLCMNTSTIRFKPKPNLLDRGFLFHTLTSSGFSAQIGEQATGSAQLNFGPSHVAKVSVALPPIGEQRAIADALGDVDALLDALDRQIAKQRDLKQAAMQQLLTGRTRLPGFTGEWQQIGFDEVFRKASTKQYQIDAAEYRDSGRYPVVDQGKASVVAWSDDAARVFHPPAEGVVVFGDHTCIIKLVRHDFVIGADGTQVLLAIPGQCAAFHAYHLQYDGIEPTGYNRHFKFLKRRSFASPALAEQTAIAAALSDMDAEIAALEARRAKTRDLKQAMLQELLTGRTRLVPPIALTVNDATA